MATNAQLLAGSTFEWNSITVGEVLSASGAFMTRRVVEVLSADSTNTVAEKLSAGAAAGPLTITCILDPTASGAYDGLASGIAAATEAAATFIFPDTSSWSATKALLTNVGIPEANGPEDFFTVTITLECMDVGGWTYTDLAA